MGELLFKCLSIVVQSLFNCCSIVVQLLFNCCSIVVQLLSRPEEFIDVDLIYWESSFVHLGGNDISWQIMCYSIVGRLVGFS